MSKKIGSISIPLGSVVRLRSDPPDVTGYVVAIILMQPYLALVRWQGKLPTFEAFDSLL